MRTGGIDIGSRYIKFVLIEDKKPVIFQKKETGYNPLSTCKELLNQFSYDTLVATGYGRYLLEVQNSAKTITEIKAVARGVIEVLPSCRTIIDIGGQDSKIIALDEEGNISKFEMNDKCAAGTGRFLEVLSERILNLGVEELGSLSLKSKDPCTLSSVCTVFAESEVISYLSEHKKREDVAYGLSKAIARRVIGMGRAAQIRYQIPICFSGGVAKNVGVVRAIEEELGIPVLILEVDWYDNRIFGGESMRTKIETFGHLLAARKPKRKTNKEGN